MGMGNGKRLPENIVRGLNFVDAVLSGSLYAVRAYQAAKCGAMVCSI